MKFRASTSGPVRLQRADSTSVPQLDARRPTWLVGADICLFASLDLGTVPRRFRQRAIEQRARELAPFAVPAWHAADHEGTVLLWLWDAERVQAAIAADATLTSADWQVLPEQVFLRVPAQHACLREAGAARVLERWRGGLLAFSASLPAQTQDISLWLRSAGLPVDHEIVTLPAQHVPDRWDLQPLDWRTLALDPVVAAAGFALASGLWLLWSLGQLAGWSYANHELETAVNARQQELSPLLAKREEALRLGAANASFGRLLGSVSALETAAEFEHLVGSRYTRLLDWQFNGRKLLVTLEDDAPDNRAYVEALDRSPWFGTVNVAPAARADQIRLDITISADAVATPLYIASARGGR